MFDGLSTAILARLSANIRDLTALRVLEGYLYLRYGYSGLTACNLFCLPEYIYSQTQIDP